MALSSIAPVVKPGEAWNLVEGLLTPLPPPVCPRAAVGPEIGISNRSQLIH